jgi:GH35 family endo-1,4-beta-xylanase
LEVCALVAVVQVLWAGYRFGAGNQSIQVAFLRHHADPAAYSGDLLLTTLPDYPSSFFRLLAAVTPPGLDLEPLLFSLHLMTAFVLLASVFWFALGLFRRERTAFVAVLFLAAGQHAGVTESDLFSPVFTHTWVAFAWATLALALLSWNRVLPACALAGLLFNIHAITALVAMAFCGLWLLASPARHGWFRVAAGLALMPLLAAPTAATVLYQAASFDATWVRLLHIRSSHHVFPFALWRTGEAQVPRFALLSAMGVLAFAAFPPPSERRRLIRVLCGGVAVLLAAGVCFTEVLPVAAVMRAQLLRASAFAALFALIAIAHWVDCLWGHAAPARRSWVGRMAAVAVAAGVALPDMRSLWPALLAATALFTLWQGRLSVAAAASAGTALVLAVVAWREIAFHLVEWPARWWRTADADFGAWRIAAALAACVFALTLAGRGAPLWARAAGRAALLLMFAVLAVAARDRSIPAESSWIAAQKAVRDLTPPGALLLTPPMSSGFRIHSQRAIVGEWRDGTQQFFSPVFAERWWARMQALRPGVRYDATGERLLAPGTEWERMSEDQLEIIFRQFGATHLVFPANRPLEFKRLYANADWTLYRAERIPPPPPLPPPPGVTNAVLWQAQERFMKEVVLPNIERHRKTDVRLSLTEGAGRPLRDAQYEVRQVRNGFLFGSALPHFAKPAARADFDPGVVDPRELERFLEIFNFSVIGYSGKWACIEPEEGKPDFADLDRYVAWCATNRIGIEYHFITGYPPKWLMGKPTEERRGLLVAHTQRLFERYGNRIAHWQVVNEKQLLQEAPAAVEWIRKTHPRAKVGLSDCAQFYSAATNEAQRNQILLAGLPEVAWLESKGAKVDFFGYHGHRPFGLWPDVRTMYEALDGCLAKGVAVHITEFGVHLNYPLFGSVRTGQWTPELQAEYYRRYFTVCFSHPAVEAINMWGMGPRTWMGGSGLLDKDYNPKPAFHTLKSLITEEWRTRLEGRSGVDGAIRFRGFHGDYELAVTSPRSGRPLRADFRVAGGAPVTLRFRWDAATDTLLPMVP